MAARPRPGSGRAPSESSSSGPAGGDAAGRALPIRCARCGLEPVAIRMVVDGNDLVMESCEKCDTRRWQLAGEQIDLQKALAEVGEHVGRRR